MRLRLLEVGSVTEAEITAKAHELYKGKSAYSDRQRAKFIRLMTSMVAPLNQLRADNEAKIAAAHASLAEKKRTIKNQRAATRRSMKQGQAICGGYAAQWRAKGEEAEPVKSGLANISRI